MDARKPTEDEIKAFHAIKSHDDRAKYLDENPHLQVIFPRVNYPNAHKAVNTEGK